MVKCSYFVTLNTNLKLIKMKKYIFTLLALIAFVGAQAQNGEIIYTDFDPDLTLTQGVNYYDSIKLDIDLDDSYDIWFGLYVELHGFEVPYIATTEGWQLCHATISDTLNSNGLSWVIVDGEGPWNGRYYGLRKNIGEDFYYGWIYLYDGQLKADKNTKAGTLFIDCMAYCTIPNYPLLVGQTSLTEEINETEATAFATVFPNPIKSTFNINGKGLKSAEVINTHGQRVATVQGNGEMLQIDIADLPVGIYFVSITDEEGRKCMRKVVKE